MDVESEIANWARWCLDNSGLFPHVPTNWQLFDQFEYKNCHETSAEKLERLEREAPINERAAERVELWVNQLPLLEQTVLRTHYVKQPEFRRHEWHLTHDQWQGRRAGYTQGRMRQLGHPVRLDVEGYESALAAAMRGVEAFLMAWARGV